MSPRRRSGKSAPISRASVLIAVSCVGFWLLSGPADAGPLLAQIQIVRNPAWAWIALVALLGAMLFSALYVGAETSLDLLRPVHVKYAREKSNKRGARMEWILEHRSSLIAAAILGRQTFKLAMVFFSLVLGERVAAHAANSAEAPSISIATLYGLAIVIPVGLLSMALDLVPKSYATLHPHRVAFRLDTLMRASWALFGVPAAGVAALANVLTSRFGGEATFEIQNPVEEEIKTIVESAEESGEIEVDERELLHSVFEFTDTVAREIMTPRVDLDAMPVKSSAAEVIEVIKQTGHSRIPLFEETDDQIVGVVHAKDLLLAALNGNGTLNLRSLMRPAMFIPENKSLHELLREMRQARTQLAVVHDEFGGTAGIVTVEDIVEELFGDIVDEYDADEPTIVEENGSFLVDGKVHLDDVNEVLHSDFESEEFDTIGGFLFGLFGRQPTLNECLDAGNWRFCVAETDGRRVVRLRVERLPEPHYSADEDSDE